MSDEDEGKVVSLAERRAAKQARAAKQRREAARREAAARDRFNPNDQSTPTVSYALLGLNVFAWLVTIGFGVAPGSPAPGELLEWGASEGTLLVRGEWWRLLTSMFMHAGVIHLAFNMYFLWSLGRICERMFRPWAYLIIYLGSGIFGGLMATAWPALIRADEAVVIVGASGALFGIFGAFFAYTIRRRDTLPAEFVKQVQREALIFMGISLALGVVFQGISLAAHLGGLNAGMGIGYLLTRLREQPADTPEELLALDRRSLALTTMITTLGLAITAAINVYLYLMY